MKEHKEPSEKDDLIQIWQLPFLWFILVVEYLQKNADNTFFNVSEFDRNSFRLFYICEIN